MGIKHTFLSPKADGPDTNVVRPSDWNSDHTIDGDVDFNGHSILQPKLGGNLDSNGFSILNPLLGGNLNPGSFGSAGNWNPSVTGTYSLGTPSEQWTDVNFSGQLLQNGVNVTPRISLTSALNFYIATTGSDSTGDGTIGNPFATLDHAYRTVYVNNYDNRSNAVVFHIADGIYNLPPAGFHFFSVWDSVGSGNLFDIGSAAGPAIYIVGNTTNSAQVVFDNTGGGSPVFNISNRISLGITGITIRNAGVGIVAQGPGAWVSLGDVAFQDITTWCIQLGYQSTVWCGAASNLRFTGTFGNGGVFVENGASVLDTNATTFTFVGTPSFAGSFAGVLNGGNINFSSAIVSGDFTGTPIAASCGTVQSSFDWTTKGNGQIRTSGSGVYNQSNISGIGYQNPGPVTAHVGGTVTQLTDKNTGVTLDKATGQIVTSNSNLPATSTATFTMTNSLVTIGDVLILNHLAGGTVGSYLLNAQCFNGEAFINIRNTTAGDLAEALNLQFCLIKGAQS